MSKIIFQLKTRMLVNESHGNEKSYYYEVYKFINIHLIHLYTCTFNRINFSIAGKSNNINLRTMRLHLYKKNNFKHFGRNFYKLIYFFLSNKMFYTILKKRFLKQWILFFLNCYRYKFYQHFVIIFL